jgi:hypothetical protein
MSAAHAEPGKDQRDSPANGLARFEPTGLAHEKNGHRPARLKVRDVRAVQINFRGTEIAVNNDFGEPALAWFNANGLTDAKPFLQILRFGHEAIG